MDKIIFLKVIQLRDAMKRLFFICILTIVFLHTLIVPAHAWHDNIIEREKNEQIQTWNNLNFKIVADNKKIDDYRNYPFNSFDVSENGDLLIGIDSSVSRKRILYVEQDSGRVIEYSCSADGTIYVNLNENNIQVFLVRGDIIIEFTKACELIAIYDAPADTQPLKEKVLATGDRYYSTNKFKFHIDHMNFPLLIKESANGEQSVVYNATKGFIIGEISVILLGTLILLAPLFIIFNPVAKRKKKSVTNKKANRRF